MSKKAKRILIGFGGLVVLLLVALITIPMFVDVNRYRGLIEAEARQALGRDVHLGEMSLSLFPRVAVRVDDVTVGGLPEEGGDLMTARRLRVGARLVPLLRKRLEVTTIVVEAPRFSLVRGLDGKWNVQRLIAAQQKPSDLAPADATTAGTRPAFRIGRFRLTEGRLEIRDENPAGEAMTVTLTDLKLSLTDVTPDGPVGFELSTSWEEVPEARIRVTGQAGPLFREKDESLEITAAAEIARVDTGRLLALVAEFYPVPDGLIGGTDVSVATKLDLTAGKTHRLSISDTTIDGLELSLLQSANGSWNLPVSSSSASDSGGETKKSTDGNGPELLLTNVELRDVKLTVRGEPLPGRSLDLSIEDLDARLDRLPVDEPGELVLSGLVNGEGRLSVKGRLGPFGSIDGSTPVELEISLDPVPASLVRLVAAEGFRLDAESGQASLALAISGAAPRDVRAVGSLRLAGYRADWIAPDGKVRSLPLDVGAEYDVTLAEAGGRVRIDKLAVELPDSRAELRGAIASDAAGSTVDLELLPTTISAGDLTALLGMVVGELPASFTSTRPIALQAKIQGPVGSDRIPRIDGVVELNEFTLMHPSLKQPLTDVVARVILRGETVLVDRLKGVAGSSDFEGEFRVRGFKAPNVEFDLTSNYADFGELFSFLQAEEATTSTASSTGGAVQEDPLAGMRLTGDIRIGSGRFDTLQFQNLDAKMTWVDDVLTLDPVTLLLYDGVFTGDIIGDLTGDEPAFDIRGDARSIDIDRFLAENLGSAGLLYGRFSGQVETSTVGADYESIVRELKGSGRVEVEEGRVAGLDVLKTLTRVSGMFGEDTLRTLGTRLAQEGTAFETMSGGVRFDGGQMRFDGLLLDSPDFALSGVGAVDLLGARLDGDFQLRLSSELSAMMRAEKSRAGELFWNGSNRRVEVPFGLKGPFNAPSPSVDWNAVAQTAVRGRVEDEVRKYLGDRLGGKQETEPPASQPPKAIASAGDDPRPSSAPAPSSAIKVEMTKIGWGGSVLLPDLEMEGAVSGERIESAEIRVIDARGAEIQRDRLSDVERFLNEVADRSEYMSIRFKYEVDGKKMALAKFPVSVRLTAFDTAGKVTERVFEVDR